MERCTQAADDLEHAVARSDRCMSLVASPGAIYDAASRSQHRA
jgi:hypothetical protein